MGTLPTQGQVLPTDTEVSPRVPSSLQDTNVPQTPAFTQEEFSKIWWATIQTKGEIKGLLKQLERVEGFVFFGFIVLVFTVLGMGFGVSAIFIDYLENKRATTDSLRSEMQEIRDLLREQCPYVPL